MAVLKLTDARRRHSSSSVILFLFRPIDSPLYSRFSHSPPPTVVLPKNTIDGSAYRTNAHGLASRPRLSLRFIQSAKTACRERARRLSAVCRGVFVQTHGREPRDIAYVNGFRTFPGHRGSRRTVLAIRSDDRVFRLCFRSSPRRNRRYSYRMLLRFCRPRVNTADIVQRNLS